VSPEYQPTLGPAFGLPKGPLTGGWRCGALAPKALWGEVYRSGRAVLCNRVPDHKGPHRYVRKDDFAVLLEWD
jgi:hypothetical protein